MTNAQLHTGRERNRAQIDIPSELKTPHTKLVYLYLASVGRASPDRLAEVLDMKKLALFPTLQELAGSGLVERRGEVYVATGEG